MSREIRFRAWDKQHSKMIANEELFCAVDWDMPDLISYILQNVDYTEGDYQGKDNYVLEQFTGLHDKNGVEIYEGDIVWWQDAEGFVAVVEWADFRWLMHEPPNKDHIGFDDISNEEVEVIGNINENPELLG